MAASAKQLRNKRNYPDAIHSVTHNKWYVIKRSLITHLLHAETRLSRWVCCINLILPGTTPINKKNNRTVLNKYLRCVSMRETINTNIKNNIMHNILNYIFDIMDEIMSLRSGTDSLLLSAPQCRSTSTYSRREYYFNYVFAKLGRHDADSLLPVQT
jgi:hypothetical protein